MGYLNNCFKITLSEGAVVPGCVKSLTELISSVRGLCWMKIVNKTWFEKGLLLSFNECRAPLGFISVFYLEWA